MKYIIFGIAVIIGSIIGFILGIRDGKKEIKRSKYNGLY